MSNPQDYSPTNNPATDPTPGSPHVHTLTCGCPGAQQDQSHLYAHGHLHLTSRTKAVIMPISLALLVTAWIIYWFFPSQRFMGDIYALI